jgi:hypothetical protein
MVSEKASDVIIEDAKAAVGSEHQDEVALLDEFRDLTPSTSSLRSSTLNLRSSVRQGAQAKDLGALRPKAPGSNGKYRV